MTPTTDAKLTVEQIAQRFDMSVRNVREYQSLGLLPAPLREGRVGYYDTTHVERIERIRALRASGFPLGLIRRVLEQPEDETDELLSFARTIAEPFQDEQPEIVTREAFVERFRIADDVTFDRATRAGLLRVRDDGRLELPSPRLARVGDAMVQMGLGLDEMLGLMREVRRHQEAVAKLFIDLFRERVWEPFEAAGEPAEGLPAVHGLLDLVRPRAQDTVVVAFKMAMDDAVKEILEATAKEPST